MNPVATDERAAHIAAVSPESLDAPTPIAPANGEVRVDPRDVTLSWVPARYNRDAPVEYDLYLNSVFLGTQVDPRAQVGRLDAGTTHMWRVVARVSSGLTRSFTATFRTDAAPNIPMPTSPREGSHDHLEQTTFSWTPSIDADGDKVQYEVQLRNSATNRITTSACASDGSACGAFLDLDTAYSWSVVASDGVLDAQSAWIHFRTDAPPRPPQQAPTDDGSIQLPRELGIVEPPTSDPDGDSISYAFTAYDSSGNVAATCPTTPTPECNLVLPKFGASYTITERATDALGLWSESDFTITTRLPIVLIHGWHGDSATWDGLREDLLQDGYPVLDFTRTTGTASLAYSTDDEGIAKIASTRIAPAVDAALRANGYPEGQRFDIVAHSMGGLVSRWLIEQHGTRVTETSILVDTPEGWNTRARTLTMLATPNHGANYASDCTSTACAEMVPDSDFLTYLGYSAGTRATSYRAMVGDADAIVTTESARLNDVPPNIFHRVCHSAGYGFFCDYPIVRAPQTLQNLETLLGDAHGPK